MRDKRLKVAILLATYNGESYLREQINSIINQTYTDWHLIISDDGSEDQTNLIIDSFISRMPERISKISSNTKFKNPRDNFFYLLFNSDSDIYFFCDQDDFWVNNKIEIFIKELEKYDMTKPLLLHSDLEVVDSKLNRISSSFFKFSNINPRRNKLNYLLVQNTVTGCSMLINDALKKKLELIKNIDNSKSIIMHDWFSALVASSFGQIITLTKSLTLYRQHQSNNIGAKKKSLLSITYNHKAEILNYQRKLSNSLTQTQLFYSVYFSLLSRKQRKIITDYITISKNKNKLMRMYLLCRKRYLKNGMLRKLGQLILS